MQDYISFAEKNGVTLLDEGPCQFCGAQTSRGIHECLEIFNLGFQQIDFSENENHIFRFLIVDAHTLQHPEIHGRWNNHFHLSRLHAVLHYNVQWTYQHSPMFSDFLNAHKLDKKDEVLTPPKLLERGNITTTDVLEASTDEATCKSIVQEWATSVYESWDIHHATVDKIVTGFIKALSEKR